MSRINKLDKQQASAIIGGYRTYASKAGCESNEGKGQCFKSRKDGSWKAGAVFSSDGK